MKYEHRCGKVAENVVSLQKISSKYDKYVFNEMTDNLKWFSEQHPLTFWVGFVAYVEADRKRDRIIKKFATMDIKRHRFKKR